MRVREHAVWLFPSPAKVVPARRAAVVCVVRDRGIRRWEQRALVVSIDQLRSTLQGAAGGVGARIGRR